VENFFQLLNASPASSLEDIAANFRALSMHHHPDMNGGVATEEYTDIVNAYATLKDSKLRHSYIKWLELTQEPCPNCKGTGVEWRQRGFSGGEVQKCAHCKGGGYHARS
jgi:DnaJ-class molecular chaperone